MNLRNSEPVRLYLYPVALAVLGVLGYYGVVESGSVPVWTVLIGAALSVGGIETARSKVSPVQGDTQGG